VSKIEGSHHHSAFPLSPSISVPYPFSLYLHSLFTSHLPPSLYWSPSFPLSRGSRPSKPARESGERCGHQTVSMHSEVKNRPPMSGDSGVEEVYRRRTSVTIHKADQREFWGVRTPATQTAAAPLVGVCVIVLCRYLLTETHGAMQPHHLHPCGWLRSTVGGTPVFGRQTDPVLRSACSRRMTTMWVSRLLQVSQLGQLSLLSFRS